MEGRECHHCNHWVEEGEEHDCWTTNETALTQDLSGDLQDAWERLRETAVSFGDQRIYASHKSVMFSRKSCYLFVRPKRKFLEVCVFLGRALKALRCDASIAHRSPRSFTSFRSGTGTRWRRPSPTGFGRHTNYLTCGPRTPTRSAPTRHRNLDRIKIKGRSCGKALPPGSQGGGNGRADVPSSPTRCAWTEKPHRERTQYMSLLSFVSFVSFV
jgi:uncharacterized protein DUF5655